MRARAVRRGAALGLGMLWWWAVARLLLVPDAGALEAAVAAGGWGLSVLPVHCMPKVRAEGALAAGRWRRAWNTGAAAAPGAGTPSTVITASPRPRPDGESGRR
ncbi:hypothetical protein DIZ27_21580 [Streptomyces sp. NWU339]|uniref:hypothetical protein n=1 Tax=Streptomyces sp. NWU339 TaxID=2185284 RepID=UPI000D67CC3C|nr:hypothetical protein [Streptomyces sp. NWU339]PWI08497.1 hypothetical protein DIZ27_21580 [Streptomyces sp. NWU339]